MCKLLIASKQNLTTKEFKQIIKAQYSILDKEKDGIGALIGYPDKPELNCIREYTTDYSKFFENIDKEISNGANFVSLHSRTSTGGETSLHNVHFFNDNGYYFAHNGWVTELSTSRGNYSWNYSSVYNDYGNTYPKSSQLELGYDPRDYYSANSDDGSELLGDDFSMSIINDLYIEEAISEDDYAEICSYYSIAYSCAACMQEFNENTNKSRFFPCCDTHKSYEKKVYKICGKKIKQRLAKYREINKITTKETCKKESYKSIPRIEDNKDCDSLQFLKSISNDTSDSNIEKEVKDKQFYGLGFLINSKDNAKILVYKESHFCTKKNGFFIFSYSPTNTIENTEFYNFKNITLYKEKKAIPLFDMEYKICEGIHKLNLN